MLKALKLDQRMDQIELCNYLEARKKLKEKLLIKIIDK